MKYFLHDCNALNDEKISELIVAHGYEGLGLFYSVLEKIGAQEKPVKTTVLKHQLNVGKKLDKCWSFMEEIGLISSNNGETFNERILSYSEKYQIKKEKNRERISQWRENQVDAENVTSYELICNASKVKESKVKEESIISYAFESDSFKDKYGEWIVAKKESKRKLTPLTISKQMKFLSKFSEHVAIKILEKSIMNGWQGLFEPTAKENTGGIKPVIDLTDMKALTQNIQMVM